MPDKAIVHPRRPLSNNINNAFNSHDVTIMTSNTLTSLTQYNYNLKSQISRYAFKDFQQMTEPRPLELLTYILSPEGGGSTLRAVYKRALTALRFLLQTDTTPSWSHPTTVIRYLASLH